MKLRHLLFGVLAGVAFVACTNDNEPAGVTPADGNKVATADKYISVDLKLPGGASTRATGDFVAATQEENDVKKATFLFFNGEDQVADPFTIAAGGNDAAGDKWTPGTTNKKAPVVVMKNPSDYPTSLVVLINYGGTVAKTQKLSALQAIVADYSATTNGFVMSNSVYNDAAGNVIGAPVTSANIKNTAADAKAAPVKVYVERVLAKVSVTKDADVEITSGDENITVDITGWTLAYVNSQSYLIKKLNKTYSYDWTWNDPTNHRSYWAESATYKAATGTAYNKPTALGATLYAQESTSFTKFTDGAATNPTAVIVNATLKYNGTAQDLYKYYGVVYTEDALKTILANSAAAKQYYKKTSAEGVTPATYESFAAADFTLVKDAEAGESYEAKVNLEFPSSAKIFDATGASVTVATANAALAEAAETLEYWNGGATYYYVPIKQVPDAGVFGIVRNHFYQLNVTKVQGLGTAVPDPSQVIIPETPEEDDYYIAAEINILDWRSVEEDVTLGGE